MEATWVDWLLVIGTGGVAFHGLTYHDANGEKPWVHLLFGSIGLIFCIRFLFHNILGIW